MSFSYIESDEQIEFRHSVSRFLGEFSTPHHVRDEIESESGFDAEVWTRFCSELGVGCIHIPEEYGGHGFGLAELGIIAEECGRHLYTGPFFSSIIVGSLAVLAAADEAHKISLLPDIGSGEKICSVSLGGLSNLTKLTQGVQGKAIEGDVFELTGSAQYAIGGQTADLLFVFATIPEGVGLFLVGPDAEGVTLDPLSTLDQTRRVSNVTFNRASAKLIGRPGPDQIEALWDNVCLMLAHEMLGGTQALFTSTLDHLTTRFQFGRAIGSFQGLKHRCADLAVEIELAKAAAFSATRTLEESVGIRDEVNMAKALANEVYVNTAIAAIQLHGGMGFTWENDTHFWFKRARASEQTFGSTEWHREKMMSRLLEAV